MPNPMVKTRTPRTAAASAASAGAARVHGASNWISPDTEPVRVLDVRFRPETTPVVVLARSPLIRMRPKFETKVSVAHRLRPGSARLLQASWAPIPGETRRRPTTRKSSSAQPARSSACGSVTGAEGTLGVWSLTLPSDAEADVVSGRVLALR